MATVCLSCAKKMDVKVPAIRVSRLPCYNCGGFDQGIDRNYSVAAMQIPGSAEDPNRQAEVEDATH